MKRRTFTLSLLLFMLAAAARAGELPYDEAADAKESLKQAFQAARTQNKLVLVVFGANWCADCRALDREIHAAQTAKLMDEHFAVVKIDVGRFDKNLDIAGLYGNPIKKGIPAVAVLTPASEMKYSSTAGELANARSMGQEAVFQFFTRIANGEIHGSR
jgi:thioredoxin 1